MNSKKDFCQVMNYCQNNSWPSRIFKTYPDQQYNSLSQVWVMWTEYRPNIGHMKQQLQMETKPELSSHEIEIGTYTNGNTHLMHISH